MIRIKRLCHADVQKILKLEEQYPPKSRKPLTEEEAIKLLDKYPNACLVAEDGKEIVGYVVGEVEGKECRIRYANIKLERIGESIMAKLYEALLYETKCKLLSKL